jgi:hypothetical protein
VIIFATGFDAMTGALLQMGIVGKGGVPLAETRMAGPRTYLMGGVGAYREICTKVAAGEYEGFRLSAT